ncbi:zinc finger protein, putative [Plasmodium knowlesi strain H]|uniref:Zinc finger protein, putative n=3 Tax=Plasmodium knowlesi TaxID=5850 RepID=A0A5K1UNS4_PLAKH|nr:zinc finger protein, putative [Plasmodium knowlesi strain H]OTN65307.1 putative Zinc finger protein [Plasmodium knowlesi]CAA9989454.1 zinc finger protein, putative [Plasmodium knowlesi strain H]SBO25094.1 zinc finger protein, putative [Plasmodium knowlesi strain H]SBO27819.1 zinc finger protein, putative [Plasmodium knowlesi strain H]VVS78928.1 zinc finger protein, putative [Plasmodium knowlesi strain H]|eukprot:XP_002260180.1 Zinc finger protein, putative [Plasmodium knowlesi strain H]
MVYATLLSEEDLSRFRTKQCKRLLNGGCNFGIDRCQYSHNEFWNRRCPFYLSDSSFIRYITIMCPDVETKSDGSINSLCLRGGECPFAHSAEEILYHPLYYKTKRCEDYKKGSCNTYYCPFIHGLAETRIPGTYKLPFTNGISIPNIPNVIIVDKIDITSKTTGNISGGDRYMKNVISSKKRSDVKLVDHLKFFDNAHFPKMNNCMMPTSYSSIDSIPNNNTDASRSNCGKKITLSFSHNFVNNSSEEDLKKGRIIFNEENTMDHFSAFSKDGLDYSINSFTNFDKHMMDFPTHGNSTDMGRSSPNTLSCTNYNEFLGGNMDKGENRSSIKSSLSTQVTDGLHPANNWNKHFNMIKMKQNYSSCSTAAHEINFNEHDMTSDEVVEDDEEDLDNYLMNTLLPKGDEDTEGMHSGNGDQIGDEKVHYNYQCNCSSASNERNDDGSIHHKPSCSAHHAGEEQNTSEINLLEIIRCLKNLYERIMKGNLVFSPEQWDNIAKITYEIVRVVEFNRILKLKRTTDMMKSDICSGKNQFPFDMSKMTDMWSEGMKGSTARLETNVLVREVYGKEENSANEQGEEKDGEIAPMMKEENINDTIQISTPSEAVLSEMKNNLESKRENMPDGMSMDVAGDTYMMTHLYQGQEIENYPSDKNDMDLFNVKRKILSHQLNSMSDVANGISGMANVSNNKITSSNGKVDNANNEEENSKDDPHFLDYYNLNKGNFNFAETKENADKILSQQPFMSFFSFLSE